MIHCPHIIRPRRGVPLANLVREHGGFGAIAANRRRSSGGGGGGGGGDINYVSSVTYFGNLRNDYAGLVGLGFTVGASDITVTQLGRWVTTDAGVRVVSLCSGSYGTAPTTLGSVSIDTSGAPVGFAYVALATPVALTAGVQYFIFSDEIISGYQWYNDDTSIATTSDAVNNGSFYVDSGIIYNGRPGDDHTYVLLDFIFNL